MWLVGVGEIYGCGCKEVYRFPHTTPLVSVPFCSSIPLFSLKKCFSFLFQYFFVITFYVLNNFFARSIKTLTGNYGRPTAAI